jgi:hypothetical protein
MCKSALERNKKKKKAKERAWKSRDRQRRRRRFLENAKELRRWLVADFFRCVNN